jgi:hypothetical protein
MTLLAWVVLFALCSLLYAWILFGGGAEWLDGSILSAFLVDSHAPRWSPEGIKHFVGATWVLQGIWFVVGLFWPAARIWY